MIESATIKNFRCFEEAHLEGLKRFNLITGTNASGKTALLESLFLASGSTPEIALRTKAWRGLPLLAVANQRSLYEEIWRDLFYCFDQTKVIQVSLNGSELDTRSLQVSYSNPQKVLIPIPPSTGAVDASPIIPITFEWTDGGGRRSTATPLVTPSGLAINAEGQAVTMPAAFFSSANLVPAAENALYLSNLSIRHADQAIVDKMKTEFPLLKGMNSETRPSGSAIYATVSGVNEKMPINLLSSGINKLISLLLGIANQPGGIICIDEIENGFYYDRLISHLRVLMNFCKDNDVQIFASTHSFELLAAAAVVAKENENEFSLIRLEKPNGHSRIRQFTGKAFRTSIEQEREVR